MSLQVEIHQDFPQPLSQVFADLADHEKLGRILGAPMTRLVDGSGEGGVNGLGSVRRVGPPVLGFEETVVGWKKDELIEYTVSKGGPIKNHLGRMIFRATPNGCHLHYVITFDSKIPFAGPAIRNVLQKAASEALARYAKGG
ncbi:MAG: SRPBCC family protein [Polyangiales bacterium]